MPSEFPAAGKSAIDAIPVPAFSFDAVRRRADAARSLWKQRLAALGLLLAVGALGAAAAGNRLYRGVTMYLTGNGTSASASSLTYVRNPMAPDLRRNVERAPFHVVLPVGLPAGTTIPRLLFAPGDRPTSITLEYVGPNGFHTGFSLFSAAALEAKGGGIHVNYADDYHWRVGDEIVLAPKRSMPPETAARIERAMRGSTLRDSMHVTESMLATVIVPGTGPVPLARAERYAPKGTRAVLLDAKSVASIPALIAKGRALPDWRTQSLADVLIENGDPSYSPSKGLTWSNEVAVPLQGLRAIESVLRSHRCDCAVLFAEPAPGSYAIWTIPYRGGRVEQYRAT